MNGRVSERALRQFGIIAALMLLVMMVMGWDSSTQPVRALGVGGCLMIVVATIFTPRVFQPIYVGLMLVTWPIRMLVSEVALLAIYFGVVCPLGIAMRLLGRDRLEIRKSSGRETYWKTKKQASSRESYFRQF